MSLLQVELPPEISADDAKLLLAIKLYETDRLSIGQAAKMAGYSKRAFVELVSWYGVPVVGYSAAELAQEMTL